MIWHEFQLLIVVHDPEDEPDVLPDFLFVLMYLHRRDDTMMKKRRNKMQKKNHYVTKRNKINGNIVLFTSRSGLPLSSIVLLLLLRRSIIALAFALISL